MLRWWIFHSGIHRIPSSRLWPPDANSIQLFIGQTRFDLNEM
jgi:hypothetical protein